jgi:hypothetical protein
LLYGIIVMCSELVTSGRGVSLMTDSDSEEQISSSESAVPIEARLRQTAGINLLRRSKFTRFQHGILTRIDISNNKKLCEIYLPFKKKELLNRR